MKKVLLSAAIPALLAPLAFADIKLPRVSPKATVTQAVGLTDVSITYSRPGVKGRTIWGGLVPYDQVWRTGANEATIITISQDVKINAKPLAAGTYSLHTIPGKTAWTVIFNKKGEQWGSYEYDQAQDALRIQVEPKTGASQEWMVFSFPEVTSDAATVELAWEKLRIPFRIETNTREQALANIRQALAGEVKEWDDPYGAANYAFNANLDNKAEAMQWIDRSIAIEENYWNLRLKASMLEKEGRKKEAIALAEKAVKIGKEKKEPPSEVAKTEKQISDWKASIGG
jgi:tetratricopeptide (TPR) repeat protein